MTVEGALRIIKENSVRWVDVQFTDMLGKLQHVTLPARDFDADCFSNGFGKLDGSSIKGFTKISESDMVLLPIADSMTLIPWMPNVARVMAKVMQGSGKGRFERDPRYIAEEAENYQKGKGYKSFFGPEPEFFIFDKVDIDASRPQSGTSYSISAREAPWQQTGSFIVRHKEGYYPAPPVDQLMDIRLEAADMLTQQFGLNVEATHHEVATSQGEITFEYSTLVDTADKVQLLKYVLRNVAANHGMVATFMPKPMFGDNGSGMHTHFSVWNSEGKKNLMYDPADDYAELSKIGRYVIGGILNHARALSAIVSPTTNSYRRLIPGYEAPVYTAWSKANRSAVVRVPAYYKGVEHAKRVEYRAPDPTSNPYLVFAGILMAAIDGIDKKMEPVAHVDADIYHLTPEKRKELGIGELPRSLEEALDELETDRSFLKPAFNSSFLDAYIELKREEVRSLAQYPHPMEHYYYLDA